MRFAGVPDDYAQPAGEWGPPRVAYLQHANDPVVSWSPGLLVRVPDWLREPPVPGRTPTMRWYPVLTFLQMTVDKFVGPPLLELSVQVAFLCAVHLGSRGEVAGRRCKTRWFWSALHSRGVRGY